LVRLKNNDRIKFGKETSTYTFEINNQFQSLRALNTLAENENTIVYPNSMIRDDRISLVNEEVFKKTTRNHFDKRYNVENKPEGRLSAYSDVHNNSNNQMSKNSSSQNINPLTGMKLPLIGTVLNNINNEIPSNLDSPKFNNSKDEIYEKDHFNNFPLTNSDLNMTFKNSKKNYTPESDINSKKPSSITTHPYEEIYVKLEKLSKDNDHLSQKNLELEGQILQKTNELKKFSNSSESLNEEYSKLTAKHNALLIYASDIQKKVDSLEVEIIDKNREIDKYKGSDWGKLLTEKENLIRVLQNEVSIYKTEIHKIKSNLLSTGKGYVNDITKRIDSLLEIYLNENKKYKKILEEYKLRENECSRKWNELLKENSGNVEKINLLHGQLNDQTNHFNNVISDYDKRVAETLIKVPRLLEQFDIKKSEAAQYLVDQMNLIMEEKRRLINENSELENKIEILTFDNEKLKLEIKNLNGFFENMNYGQSSPNVLYNSNDSMMQNFNQINIKSLKMKIDELEDLLTQYKNTNSPNKIVSLEEQILSLNNRLAEKDKQIENLNNKLKEYLKKTNLVFDEREAINSLSNAMREKDIIILNLKNQIREMRDMEKVKNYELDNLSRILDKQPDNSKYNFNKINILF
jgi:chromosome segregation ATPase